MSSRPSTSSRARRRSANTPSTGGAHASEARDMMADDLTTGVKLSVGTRFTPKDPDMVSLAGSTAHGQQSHGTGGAAGSPGAGGGGVGDDARSFKSLLVKGSPEEEKDSKGRLSESLAWLAKHEESPDFSFKVAIVGGRAVGKRTIIKRECGEWQRGPFIIKRVKLNRLRTDKVKRHYRSRDEPQQETTAAITFQRKMYSIDQKRVSVEYWIGPSSETHLPTTSRILSTTSAAVFIFNPYDRLSYDMVQRWVASMYHNREKPDPSSKQFYPFRVLMANSIDVRPQTASAVASAARPDRKVTEKEASEYAERNGLLYHECNANDHRTFNVAFTSLARLVLGPLLSKTLQPTTTITGKGASSKAADPAIAGLKRGVTVYTPMKPHQRLVYMKALVGLRPNQALATQVFDWM
ncbi:Ras- protein Rab-25 [Irineochytrium annulatum]|nr:Ras- protein Rab-25 [Irineochytrium annulatum]